MNSVTEGPSANLMYIFAHLTITAYKSSPVTRTFISGVILMEGGSKHDLLCLGKPALDVDEEEAGKKISEDVTEGNGKDSVDSEVHAKAGGEQTAGESEKGVFLVSIVSCRVYNVHVGVRALLAECLMIICTKC